MSEIERLTDRRKFKSGRRSKGDWEATTAEGAKVIYAMTDKLADHEDAEEQGLLIKLPCKVGDSVWVLTSDSPTGIEKTSVSSVRLTKNSYRVACKCVHDDWGNAHWEFKPQDFGVKAFVSESAAKRALHHD